MLIVGVRVDIRDFLDGAAEDRAGRGPRPSGPTRTSASHGPRPGRQPMRGRKMHELAIEPEHVAKLGFAQSRRAADSNLHMNPVAVPAYRPGAALYARGTAFCALLVPCQPSGPGAPGRSFDYLVGGFVMPERRSQRCSGP